MIGEIFLLLSLGATLAGCRQQPTQSETSASAVKPKAEPVMQTNSDNEQPCELPNGYAFRLPADGETMLALAEWMNYERLCCPFFNFAIELERNGGPLWLKLSGGEGIKPFIQAEFNF